MGRIELEDRTDTQRYPATVTRLVVLGDPHGDLLALRTVVAREAGEGVAFVSVGDNVGYAAGEASSAFCKELQRLGARSVYGNHEAWLEADGRLAIVADRSLPRQLDADALAYCAGLPRGLSLAFDAAPDLRVGVRHTLGDRWDFVGPHNADQVAVGEGLDVAIIGHSHGARIYRVDDSGAEPVRTTRLSLEGEEALEVPLARRLVVDAGSLGRPGYHPDPEHHELATYATLDLRARVVTLHAVAPDYSAMNA